MIRREGAEWASGSFLAESKWEAGSEPQTAADSLAQAQNRANSKRHTSNFDKKQS